MTNKNGDARPAVSVKPHAIAEEIDLFVRQIDSLADTLPMTIHVIQALNQTSEQDYQHFLEQECKPTGEGEQPGYHVEAGKYFKFRRLEGRYHKARLAHQLVPRTFLVSLVSQFDAFLGRLLKQVFNIKPETIDSSASTLTFSQLTDFGSVENAREYIIDKEIETVLRKSHVEQFDWLENKFGLQLRTGLEVWPVFVEVTERRNLFVHSNGIASHQYLEVCKRHGSLLEPAIISGKMLFVSRQYFEAAHECVFEIGVKLAQVLWRKLRADDLVAADANFIRVSYELLEEGRYRLARCLLDFSTGLKKHGKEEQRLAMIVNRAQAYKWSGDEATARKIVTDEDWSATGLKFQMAQAVLSDDFERALQIMIKIGTDADLGRTAYREWPLFKEIRKTSEFSKTFENIFAEPLNIIRPDPEPPILPNAATIH